MGPVITKNELVPSFVKLLKDTEAEVRTVAASKVAGVCSLLPEDLSLRLVLPPIKDLVTDPSQHVRGKACSRWLCCH